MPKIKVEKREHYDEGYWYTKFQEQEAKFSEYTKTAVEAKDKEIGDLNLEVEGLKREKEELKREKEELNRKLKSDEMQFEQLKELKKFDTYLREYADLLRKSWVISVDGYREGQTTRKIHVATITRGNDTVTPIDPMPEQRSFSSADDYLVAATKYLEALKDIDKTRKEIEEYQRKYPAIGALVDLVEDEQNKDETKGG